MSARWLPCWLGLAIVAVASLGAFTPLGYAFHTWAFPSETALYANEPKGGPYPELFWLMIVLPGGLLVTGVGFLLAWAIGPKAA